jgi:tRNA/tmRNA/rRNA uracil-C5-methylase (TrmA/RlmC/RlmD family)
VTVSPEKLVAGGDALARIDGFPVFIANCFPGDEVRVRIDEVKKGFARGVVEELVVRGPLRRMEPCSVAQECGGCDWTALRLDHQLRFKREILIDTLLRVGKLEAADIPAVAIHPSPLNYRLRSRLHFEARTAATGFYAMRSHRVVPLPAECEVVGPDTIHFLEEVRSTAVEFQTDVSTFEASNEFLIEPAGEESSETIVDTIDHSYAVRTDGFFQVNRHLLATLTRLVAKHARAAAAQRHALDIYGGVGFFAVPLSKIFEKVTLVETSRRSIAAARANASTHPNIRIVEEDAARYLRQIPRDTDFIMVDPPRTGLAPEVTDAIAGATSAVICHLSCDPVTFARDVARLRRRGWRLSTLDLVDLFPNTHHIETLSLLTFDPSGRTS